ncbi:MAG: CPBP family intramembrane metalloprotease [Promethearchaeota archaeon]|nr:MAG: CPBP family intramembrane metalloprotease [Candidatus Lokiarchaeota archaeon]
MFVVNERRGKFTQFFVPSMLVILSPILLYFIQNCINTIMFTGNIVMNNDLLIQSLSITFISHIIAILLVYFVIIPLVDVKTIDKKPIFIKEIGTTILLLFITVSVVFIINLGFKYIINFFNLNPISGYSGIILNSTQASNPLNVIIYFLPFTIGAPIFEELVYRRTLLPLMEKRGMSSFVAIIVISVIFAVAHFPNDLVNGNLYGGIVHIVGVFFISISLGISYVLTRNIIFPIIIHSLINLISFSGPLITVFEDVALNLIYNFVVNLIVILGIGFMIYCAWCQVKKKNARWLELTSNKSIRNIKFGVIIFLFIGISSSFLPIILEFFSIMVLVISNNIDYYFSVLLFSQLSVIIITGWLSKHAKVEVFNKLEKKV